MNIQRWITFFFTQRGLWLSMSLAALFAMIFALYMEKIEGLLPCNLCMLQRAAMVGLGVWCMTAFIHNPGRVGQILYGVGSVLLSCIGCLVAGRHVWLQSLPEDQVPACGPDFDFLMDQFPLFETLLIIMEGSGGCAEVKWSFLGLSMPEHLLIVFGCYLIASFLQSIRAWKI